MLGRFTFQDQAWTSLHCTRIVVRKTIPKLLFRIFVQACFYEAMIISNVTSKGARAARLGPARRSQPRFSALILPAVFAWIQRWTPTENVPMSAHAQFGYQQKTLRWLLTNSFQSSKNKRRMYKPLLSAFRKHNWLPICSPSKEHYVK